MRGVRFLTGQASLDWFLIAVYSAAFAAAVMALGAAPTRFSTHLILLALYAAAAAPYLVGLGNNVFLSTGFPFILAAAVFIGPEGAVVTAVAAGVSLGVARRSRMRFHKGGFNAAAYTLSGLTAAYLYPALGGNRADFSLESSLRAFLGATGGFYLVNTFLVTMAASLESAQPPFRLWVEKFHWTAYSFLAGGSASLLVILFLQKAGLYSFLILFPFCALIYHSWKVYTTATGLPDREQPASTLPEMESRTAPRRSAGLF